MEALFTSVHGGDALRRRVIEVIAEAASLTFSGKVDLHVMMFAFTDYEVAEALIDAATRHSSINVRIIADWSQRNHARNQQVGRLAGLGLPNLRIRYKKDQPYLWDATAGQLRWSYRVSRGLLHHKTLAVLVNGRPRRLICGSFNWTATAARSYENILLLAADDPGSCELMARMELEFEALWSDGFATLSPAEAHLHYRAILEEYNRDPTISPGAIAGIAAAGSEPLQILHAEDWPPGDESSQLDRVDPPALNLDHPVAIAFNSRSPEQSAGRCGHAKSNHTQMFSRCTPSGGRKRVRLTLTNLALDTISRVAPGETMKVAMYGLSTRTPEYGALLAAARRGVRLFVLLDGMVGVDVCASLTRARHLESLAIEVRTTSKTMHQKYIVCPQSGTVLTGTANMSTDASSRHLEHRIRVLGDEMLAAQFCEDFDTIWARVLPEPVKWDLNSRREVSEEESEVLCPPSTNNESP